MSNAVYPALPGLMWPVVKIPEFNTRVQRSPTMREVRYSLSSYPTYLIRLSYEYLEAADYQALVGFFLARRGQFDNFLFTDPEDCNATNEQIGVGNGSRKDFQLLRTLGGWVEPVENVNTISSIRVNGVTKAAGTDYTVGATGIVTFTVAPPAGHAVTWSGTFYFRCRFNQDSAEFQQFTKHLWDLRKVELRGATGNKV